MNRKRWQGLRNRLGEPATEGGLQSIDTADGLPDFSQFGVAVFGPGISLPLLGQHADAACLVPRELLGPVGDLCDAERSGSHASQQVGTVVLEWLLANPSTGDSDAFGVLTEACVRATRLLGTRADDRVRAIQNALERGVTNHSCETQLMFELAHSYHDTGRFDLAARQYHSIVEYFRSQDFTDGLRMVLPPYALSLAQAGDTAEAQRTLDEFETLATTRNHLSMLWQYRASALRFLYSSGERVTLYYKSLELLNNRGGTSEGCVRVDLAEALLEAGRPGEAADELRSAIAMFDAASDALHAIRAHAVLVVARCDAGELQTVGEIELEFDALTQLRAAVGDHDGHLKDELNRILILEAAGIWPPGQHELERLRRVCAAARRSRNLLVWAQALRLRVPFELWSSEGELEDCAVLPDLIAECAEVSALLQDVRDGFVDPLDRAKSTRWFIDVNWWRVVMLAFANDPYGALVAADSMRAGTAEAESQHQIARAAAPPDVRRQEQALIRRLELTVDPAETDAIRRELRTVQNSYRGATKQIGGSSWTIASLKASLQERNECLLVFACHEHGIISIATDGDDYTVRRVVHVFPRTSQTLAQELYQRAREFVWSVAQAADGDQMQPLRHAHWLWQHLIEPHAGVVNGRNLVIVPDGALTGLPWVALKTEAGADDSELDAAFVARWARADHSDQPLDEAALLDEGSAHPVWEDEWKDLPYLGTDQRIRVATSVASACERPRSAPEPPSRVVGLADPDPGDSAEVDDLTRRLRTGRLDALPGARRELAEVGALLADTSPPANFEAILGANATREKLISLLRGQDTDVVHLAAHGQVDSKLPLRSRIFLAPTEAGDREDLTVEWVYANTLTARLVVLSCCETGLGHIAPQEGVIGIPRALVAGGVRDVVATLWRIPDDHRLMVRFYQALIAGEQPEMALAQGQRSLMAASAHPVFWSGHQHYS